MPYRPTSLSRRQLMRSIAGTLSIGAMPTLAENSRFRIFDGLLHKDKPGASRLGLQTLTAVAHVWRPGMPQSEIDEDGIRAALMRIPFADKTIFLDIESWELFHVPPTVRAESIRKFTQVAEIVKNARPDLTFGFYGVIPPITYWPLQNHRLPDYPEWLETNAMIRHLATLVDVLFPSLYTFYDDYPGWLTYATQTVEAAKQFGKPVYPFLWFEYHDSNRDLRDREIVLENWKQELRFCRNNADGVVLWGGSGRPWKNTAPWWQAAKQEFGLQSTF